MIQRTKHFYRDFPFDLDSGADAIRERNERRTAQFPQRRLSRLAVRRSVHRQCQDRGGLLEPSEEVSRDRHAHPIGEKIHISALQRLLPDPSDAAAAKPYKPTNLEKVLEAIETTYGQAAEGVGQPGADSKPSFDLPVVDWDGHEIPKHGPRAEQLLQLLARRARDAAPAVRPGAVHASAKESQPIFERDAEAPSAP